MKIAALVLILSFPLLVMGQSFTTPVRVNSDATGVDSDPAMHIGPNGKIYISWIKIRTGVTGDVYFSRSDDRGASFIPSVRATMNGKISPNLQRNAQFAIDTKGNIHMVWVENRLNSQPDVWYIRSTDDGMTWTTPVAISDDSSKYAQDFPAVACDSSGNIFVSFIDSRDNSRGDSENEQLYMVKSSDNGTTWSTARKVNAMPGGLGGTCECCKQDIQCGKNGLVTIAFRTNILNRRDIFVVRSNDFGETFAEALPVQSQQWTINACPTTGPNTYLTPEGDLYAVWRDARDAAAGKAHVYYDLLKSGAAQPMFGGVNNLRLDENENLPNWPDITFYNGYLAIAFESSSNRSTYVLAESGGQKFWTVPFPGAGDKTYMSVEFASDGMRYFTWQDKGYPTDDIVFIKDTSQLPSLAVYRERTETFLAYPNPVRAGMTLRIDAPTAGVQQYMLVDVLGRTVSEGKLHDGDGRYSLEIPNVWPGQYMLRLGSGKPRAIMIVE